MDAAAVFIGIDVAKTRLASAVRPAGEHWTAPNDDAGMAEVVQRLHE